jgi:biopolymer transport protein TolR
MATFTRFCPRRRGIHEINMVPFIDVMLVLLIIFMVTAPLMAPGLVDLPSVGQASKQPDQVIQIELLDNDSLRLKIENQTRTLALEEVLIAVRQAQAVVPQSAVVISADKNIRYEAVVKLMDALQRAGVVRLGLAVQVKS